MQKWEYKRYRCLPLALEDDETLGEINALGEQGWELVGMSQTIDRYSEIFSTTKLMTGVTMCHYLIFKRPKE
jgi:hypothetical protein